MLSLNKETSRKFDRNLLTASVFVRRKVVFYPEFVPRSARFLKLWTRLLWITWAHDGEFLLERRSYQSSSRILCPHCTSWTNWNNREVVKVTRSYIFKWRFRCRCRRRCLSSLISRPQRRRLQGTSRVKAMLPLECWKGSFINCNGNENIKICGNRLHITKTTTLLVHHTFWYISLPSLHD